MKQNPKTQSVSWGKKVTEGRKKGRPFLGQGTQWERAGCAVAMQKVLFPSGRWAQWFPILDVGDTGPTRNYPRSLGPEEMTSPRGWDWQDIWPPFKIKQSSKKYYRTAPGGNTGVAKWDLEGGGPQRTPTYQQQKGVGRRGLALVFHCFFWRNGD